MGLIVCTHSLRFCLVRRSAHSLRLLALVNCRSFCLPLLRLLLIHCTALRMRAALSVPAVAVVDCSAAHQLTPSVTASAPSTVSASSAASFNVASSFAFSSSLSAPALSTLPPPAPALNSRGGVSRPLRRRQATPTVLRMAGRRTRAATSSRPAVVPQGPERADSIEAAQRLADWQEREQAKVSLHAEQPTMRSHRRMASGRENIPPPSTAVAAAERDTDAPTMYDHIKRKTACYAIEHSNGSVRLAPTSAAAPPRPAQPTADSGAHDWQETAVPRHTRTPALDGDNTIPQQQSDNGKDEVVSAAHDNNDISRDSSGVTHDEQPGASRSHSQSDSTRRRGNNSKSRSSKGNSATVSVKKRQRHVEDQARSKPRAVADSQNKSQRSHSSAAVHKARHSTVKDTRARGSKKADHNKARRSHSASSSSLASPSPPPLSSTQRPLFHLPSSDGLYFPPILASASLALPTTAALSPFGSSFTAILSSADKSTLKRYLLASPEHVLHRVRYILRRDGSHQNHLARCLNISPATLSPMLRGVYDHLKTKHLSMMRVWAAQMDARYVQHVISAMRVWCMNEVDLSRECSMSLADIERWLLFDMPLDERNEADRSIARWMNECKQAADVLVNETVMQQFEADYLSAVEDGQLDEWLPGETVRTTQLNSVQHDKDDEVARLDEDDRRGTDAIVFNIPQLAKQSTCGRQRNSRSSTTKRTREADAELGTESEREDVEEKGKDNSEQRDGRADSGETSSEVVVGRLKKKPKSVGSSQPQQPFHEAGKRIKLEVDGSSAISSLTSPASVWPTQPATSVDGTTAIRTPLSFLSSVTRLNGDNKPSTFFYFDPSADMSQVADRWGLPVVPVLPTFTVYPSSAAHLSSASAPMSTMATPAIATSAMFSGRVLGSPVGRRVSSGSDSSPFTPNIFLSTSSPSSSILPPLNPHAAFITPATRQSVSSLLFEEPTSTASSSINHNSSLSSLSMQSLSSLLPTPVDVTNSSSDTLASATSAIRANEDQLPLARQLNLSDEEDASKQQHYATQQLEFTHAILSMSVGSPLARGEGSES